MYYEGGVPQSPPPGVLLLRSAGREFLTHLGRIHGLGRAGLAVGTGSISQMRRRAPF